MLAIMISVVGGQCVACVDGAARTHVRAPDAAGGARRPPRPPDPRTPPRPPPRRPAPHRTGLPAGGALRCCREILIIF